MGAPLSNQFWKLRDKHGRDKLWEDPEEFMKACQDYFNWVDSHPRFKNEQLKKPYKDEKGKWVMIAKIPTERPYSIKGLCIYLGVNELYINQLEQSLKEKEDEKSKDYSKILTYVRDVIYQQKFDGAATGAFNWAIIARDLSLKEKSEVTGEGGAPLNPPAVVNIHPIASSAPILEEENDKITES
jgi:hypothetical protein